MDAQRRVAEFVAAHDLEAPPAYRVLDLVAEVGEIAADTAKSTGYGTAPEDVAVAEDEIGDALFALLLVAERLNVDAESALEAALAKYEQRVTDSGDPGSGTGDPT